MIIDPSVIRQVSREKDIDAEKMFGALEEAMSSAARKYYHDKAMVTVIDRQSAAGEPGSLLRARPEPGSAAGPGPARQRQPHTRGPMLAVCGPCGGAGAEGQHRGRARS